ncbi:MAG: M48 family metallopeptidase [Armatimonadaceae bacterium]
MKTTPATRVFCLIVALASVGGAGCRRVKNIYSRSAEISLGEEFVRDFPKDRDSAPALKRGPLVDRVQRVASRILPLARQEWDVPYTVTVLDDPEVNAFAVPGGPIYFNRGLLELAESDDEIAAVLGHEAAHIVKRHSARQMSDQVVKAGLAQILLGKTSSDIQQAVAIGMRLKSLEFSRGDESESDTAGFRYLVGAGYNPDAMASFFRKMREKAGDSPKSLAFLNSHPLTSKRIEAAEKMAADYRAGKLSSR